MLTSKPGLELFTPGLESQLHQLIRCAGWENAHILCSLGFLLVPEREEFHLLTLWQEFREIGP